MSAAFPPLPILFSALGDEAAITNIGMVLLGAADKALGSEISYLWLLLLFRLELVEHREHVCCFLAL